LLTYDRDIPPGTVNQKVYTVSLSLLFHCCVV